MALQVGQVVEGRYRVVSEGTIQDIGTAYKAYDMQLDRLAVLLLLDRRLAGGEDALDRLTQANQAVADLVQPDLIPFEDAGLLDGRPYLVRSQVEGESLAGLLARAGHLEFDDAVEIAVRLCDVLAPAHRAGLVHGGLSSQSVLVGDDGRVAVVDAGLMPALRPFPAPSGRSWGRFPYLSPEQAAGETALPASDVYVLGLMLYEMLTGRLPFHSDDPTDLALQHLRQEPIPLQTLIPHIPVPLAQIVHKALAKEPAARYRNAGQLAHILRSHVGAQAEPQVGPLPAPPAPEPVVRQPRDLAQEPPLVLPPARPSPPVWLPEPVYGPGAEPEYWIEEPAGVDWLMIGLIIAALVAVLGLIPLWRTVYRRYTPPTPVAPPSSYHLPDEGISLGLPCVADWEDGVNEGTELDDFALVWYNLATQNRSSTEAFFPIGVSVEQRAEGDRISDLGVQITVLGASCIKL